MQIIELKANDVNKHFRRKIIHRCIHYTYKKNSMVRLNTHNVIEKLIDCRMSTAFFTDISLPSIQNNVLYKYSMMTD